MDAGPGQFEFDWIEVLSNGGLLVPNDVILRWIYQCECEFRGFLEYFQNTLGVSSILTQKILSKYTTMDPEVVKEFVRNRILIKIRALNNLRRESSIRKRKARQFANSSKSCS